MPYYHGREMTPDEYVSARLGIAYPPGWKVKMMAMESLVRRWHGALINAIMGAFDDDNDTHVTNLFDAWARDEADIIDCAYDCA